MDRESCMHGPPNLFKIAHRPAKGYMILWIEKAAWNLPYEEGKTVLLKEII